MDFVEKKLFEACQKGIITESQVKQLLEEFLGGGSVQVATRYNVSSFLYYFGSVIALFSMIWFMSNAINHSTYLVIFVLGLIYSLIFFFSGEYLWKKNNELPAGLLFSLFVVIVPFLVMVIEKATGFFPHFSKMHHYSNFIDACRPALSVMSFSMIFSGAAVLVKRKMAILVDPIVVGFYVLMLLHVPLLSSFFKAESFITGVWLTLVFSIALFLIAFIKDRASSVDYSGWLYYFSSGLFYLSLYILLGDIFSFDKLSLQLFIVGIFGLVYIVLGVLIQRGVFITLGTIGLLYYVFYLEAKLINITKHPMLLSSIVLITGLLIIYSGIWYFNNKSKIEMFLEKCLPKTIIKYLPKNR